MKISKKGWTFLLILLMLLGMGINSENVQAASEKTVKVGYEWGYHFQEGTNDKVEKSGYAYDYLQNVASYANWKYKYVYGSWEDLYNKLIEGKIDLMAGISETQARKAEMNFPTLSMMKESYYIYIKNDKENEYTGVKSLKGKTVGVSSETTTLYDLIQWNRVNHAGIKIVVYKGDSQRLKAFKEGKTDATADLNLQVRTKQKMVPVTRIGTENTYIAVAKKRKDILRDLNNAQATINDTDPTYSVQLERRYFGDTAEKAVLSVEERSWIKKHPTLKVGYIPNDIPFVKRKNSKMVGLFPSLLNYLCKHYHFKVKYSYRAYSSYDKLTKDLRMGKIDIAMPFDNQSWSAEQNGVLISSEVAELPAVLIQKSKKKINSQTTFVIFKKSPYQKDYLKKYYSNNNYKTYSDRTRALDDIEDGQVDALIMDNYDASIYVHSSDNLVTRKLANSIGLGFGIARKDRDLLSIINRGIDSYGTNNISNELFKYTNSAKVTTLPDFIKDNATLVNIVVACILIVIICLICYMVLRHKQENIVNRMAHYDDMTSILNRRSYDEIAKNYVDNEIPVDLVIIQMDVDHLKRTNDNLGHAAGDELIKGAASSIFNTFKKYGTVYRVGGDEFVAVLRVSHDNLIALMNNLEKTLDLWKGKKVHELRISCGYAEKRDYPEADFATLARIADDNMYEVKRKRHLTE